MVVVTPEMSGKIIDESHFDFHVTAKAKLVNAVNKMKAGGDLLKTLSTLNFTTNKEWTKNTCGDPSVAALLSILEEYKASEKRPSRARMLVPLLEYAIGLYASDLFFRERGSWFIRKILDHRNDFEICRVFEKPECWYPNTRNPDVQGPDGFFYKQENAPTPPKIEDEYKDWYGVDVTGESIVITQEMKDKAIADGQLWMRQNYPQMYNLEAEKI